MNLLVNLRLRKFIKFSSLVLTLALAACSAPLPELNNKATPVVGTEHLSFEANQKQLAKIVSLDLNGQTGIITAKERYSTTFKYQQSLDDYQVVLNVPYTTKLVSVRKEGDLYLYSADNKVHSSVSMERFSKALFGFVVPLDKLRDIILAQVPANADSNYYKNLVVTGNVIGSQVVDGNTIVNYSDYQLIDNKFLVPFGIRIVRATDSIRIKLAPPYKYTVLPE